MRYILILLLLVSFSANGFSQLLLRPYSEKSLALVFAEAIVNPEISIYHIEHKFLKNGLKLKFETQVRTHIVGEMVDIVPLLNSPGGFDNKNEDDFFSKFPKSQWIVAVERSENPKLYKLSNRGYSSVLCLYYPKKKDFIKKWSFEIVNDLKSLTNFYLSLHTVISSGKTIMPPENLELKTTFGYEVLDELMVLIFELQCKCYGKVFPHCTIS